MRQTAGMSLGRLYLVLALVGAVAPWSFFARFFAAEGAGGDFIGALFANGAAGGFTTDLLISSGVFWIFLFREGRKIQMGSLYPYVLVNLLIGLSCALPLFLWRRERCLERGTGVGTAG